MAERRNGGTTELTITAEGEATGRYYNLRGRRGTLMLGRVDVSE